MSILQPTYYTRHPDETYSVADPQPTIQPVKQEPVAWWNGKETAWFEHELCGWQAPDGCTIPLYAAPVQPVKQEPVAWHEPNAYGNVTTHKKWAEENGWLPLYTKE